MISAYRIVLLSLIIAQIVSIPRTSAAEINVTSKTYLRFYHDARDNAYAPLYEYVELESKDQEHGRWDFYLSSWWGHDFQTLGEGSRNRDELTYAYLRYSPYQDKHILISAGRHFVFEGVTAEQIDGVSARWELSPLNGVSLFGGVPVITDFDQRGGDSVYGGRIYQRIPSLAEVGLSVLNERNDGARFREEAGVDIWLLPFRKVEVKGHSFYNNITAGWGEHAYTLRLFPVKTLTLSGSYSRTSYNDAFATRTLSVFSPDFLGKDETLTKAGGMVEYRVTDAVTGAVDYSNYSYKTMGRAGYYGAKVSAMLSGISTGASVHRMEGDGERLRYLETRIYTAADVTSWRFSLDAINHHYDQPYNSVGSAYSLNGNIRYLISDALTSNFSVDYSKTPDFSRDTTVMLNLVYNFKGRR
jgi:hypothetical protein